MSRDDAMKLRQALADLDADAIAAAINRAFPSAVAEAVGRHMADGTIAMLSPTRTRPRPTTSA